MIVGVGIDSIEIERFNQWHTYAIGTLGRIFSSSEIDYCLSISAKSAERFAARFAAREAFYKALSGVNPARQIPFLKVCKNINLEKAANGYQQMNVKWQSLLEHTEETYSQLKVHLSLTHNQAQAFAFVILERLDS